MILNQYHFRNGQWSPPLPPSSGAQLILGFGGRMLMQNSNLLAEIACRFPDAQHLGCSTSGEIFQTDVYDESLVITAIEFKHTPINTVSACIRDFSSAHELGVSLAQQLPHQELRYVFALCDGQLINGSALVAGVSAILPEHVGVSGGLAGDADRFEKTVVWKNQQLDVGQAVLCGFYGKHLHIGHGSLGGWSAFGPEREITRSENNILFELDGQPALDLYKRYLGKFSEQLPASALRFPLSLKMPGELETVVRTILSVNEQDHSMIFAGDVPMGATAKLMKASFDAIIDGAHGSAEFATMDLQGSSPEFAILISCVGRRLVLGQRAFEELEAVSNVLGSSCIHSGFYSYGEISPLMESAQCRLHNQTMTITTFKEDE